MDDRKKILIVDDEEQLRELMVEMFEPQKYQCFEAGSGLEALKLLEKTEMDLVITDIRMPDMDGLSLLLEAKKQGITCPFFVTTGYSDHPLSELLSMGAKKVYFKPLKMIKLITDCDNLFFKAA